MKTTERQMAEKTRRDRTDSYMGPKGMLSEAELVALDAKGTHTAETKWDGYWCKAEVVDGVVTSLESRVGLAFAPEVMKGILGLKVGEGTGTLAGELTEDQDGVRRLHVFDCMEWNGRDMRGLAQRERRAALEEVHTHINHTLLPLTQVHTSDFLVVYKRTLEQGGEGLVLKAHTQTYTPTNADGKVEGWTRIKPEHTVDYIITGYTLSGKGFATYQLGWYRDGTLQPAMKCRVPKEWMGSDPGAHIGRVVEVASHQLMPTGVLRHGQITRLRDDKRTEDCTYEAALRA